MSTANLPVEPLGLNELPPERFFALLDSQLQACYVHLAMHDMDTYTRVKRVETRYRNQYGNQLPVAARRRLTLVVRSALDSLFREPTPAETVYAQLRVRYRAKHTEAVSASGLSGVTAEDALRARRTIQLEWDKAAKQLAAETGVTKDDVVQGLLNAVACARHSADLVLAWSELGKLLGHYEETKIRIEQKIEGEIKHSHQLDATVDVRLMSDADLMKFAGAQLIEALKPEERLALNHQPGQKVPQEISDGEFELVPAVGRAEPAASIGVGDSGRPDSGAVPGDARPAPVGTDRDEVGRSSSADNAGVDSSQVHGDDGA